MENKTVTLSTREELKVFMSPLRQELLRIMGIHGAPMTAKSLADKLNISASSAQHHIKKLMDLGLIELDHTETINGIQAKYYALTQVTVSIGQQLDDGLASERNIIVQNMLKNTFGQYIRGIEAVRKRGLAPEEMRRLGDILSGVIYLNPSEARELFEMITAYIEMHNVRSRDAAAWEYALILYNATELNKEDESRE